MAVNPNPLASSATPLSCSRFCRIATNARSIAGGFGTSRHSATKCSSLARSVAMARGAADRNAAYTAAMNGHDPGTGTCANPVAETKALSVSLGINATPTILAEDGTQVNSAKTTSPELLLAELDRLAAEHAKKVASR